MNRIVQAAAGEFRRNGYAGTTTAAVAREAGVTEAQLFRYFGSKAELFRETVFEPLDRHFTGFLEQHRPLTSDSRTLEENTRLYTSELRRFISEHSELLTSLVVAQTYASGTDHGVGRINSLAAYFDHGAAMMRARLKGKPEVDPKLMVRMAFASVLASVMFRDWIFPKGLASDEEIAAATNAFVQRGIAANAD
jgi:AcrR family transcriptional regulator